MTSQDFVPPQLRSLRLSADKTTITVSFEDGFEASLSAELLRVESPSAEVQGHGIDQKKLITGKQMVTIPDIEAVGNYAVRLIFDDGHDTGLYSWELFYDYGKRQDEMMAAYRDAVAKSSQ